MSLRGPKEDVEKCASYLKKLGSELVKIDSGTSEIVTCDDGDPVPFPCGGVGKGRHLLLCIKLIPVQAIPYLLKLKVACTQISYSMSLAYLFLDTCTCCCASYFIWHNFF